MVGHACIRTQYGILVTGGISLRKEITIDQTLLIDLTNGHIETIGSLNEERDGRLFVTKYEWFLRKAVLP